MHAGPNYDGLFAALPAEDQQRRAQCSVQISFWVALCDGSTVLVGLGSEDRQALVSVMRQIVSPRPAESQAGNPARKLDEECNGPR